MAELTPQQALRYARQINLPSMDLEGQERLLNGHVVIVGLGGLGCAAAQYLCAAGVGYLTLIDDDVVDVSNLQRQILHYPESVGIPKVASAKLRLKQQNPDIKLLAVDQKLDKSLLKALLKYHPIVLDCTDNLETRALINALCFEFKTPLVSGAAIRMEGQLMVFTYAEDEPCYHCVSRLFGEQNLSCVEAGVLSPLVGVIGNLQAIEAIKILAQIGTPMTSTLLHYDASVAEFRKIALTKHPECLVCSAID